MWAELTLRFLFTYLGEVGGGDVNQSCWQHLVCLEVMLEPSHWVPQAVGQGVKKRLHTQAAAEEGSTELPKHPGRSVCNQSKNEKFHIITLATTKK